LRAGIELKKLSAPFQPPEMPAGGGAKFSDECLNCCLQYIIGAV
jgi:hypothetical protein